MNDEHVQEELLQRYFDGELAETPAAQVAQHVQGCPHCTARHRALSGLHRAISVASEDGASGVDFEALFGRIEQGVRERSSPGLGERLSMRWGGRAVQRSRRFWMPAAGALAAAAALLVFLRNAPQQRQPPDAVPEATALAGEQPAPFINSEIEQVDFGSNAGTVFEVALAEGVSTAVVWINDDVEQVEE